MSKSVLLKGLLLRAWRERWNACQWGLNIKKILPRGVPGDAYNLADCILQQAVVGSGVNQLILSYLRHSLCSHLISYAAVLKWISNYETPPEKHGHLPLLEFVDSILPAVVCNNRQEEHLIVDATSSLIRWLWRVYKTYSDEMDGPEKDRVMSQLASVLEKVSENDFLLAILCLAKMDNSASLVSHAEWSMCKQGGKRTPVQSKIDGHFQMLIELSVDRLPMVKIEQSHAPAITYILQPLLVVELLKNAGNDQRIISQLLLVQKLKRFTRSQFYFEILRSCLLTLQNVNGTSKESLWCAFTFIKIPQILRQLNGLPGVGSGNSDSETDTNTNVLQAIDLLLEETSLLDILDFKCGSNIIKCLVKEFEKHGLVTEKLAEHYIAKRAGISESLLKLDPANQTPSIVKFVIRAEQPLSGILKTLNTDYNKVQEALLSLLFQVMHGNSLDLILSVAMVEGKLKTFVNRLIKCNECSKQVVGETGKPAATRAALFDVTFLYLVNIVQTYGAETVLEEHGESYFESWVRHAMVDRRKLKSPMTIVRACDQVKVDELLHVYLNGGTGPSTTMKWHEIAENIPGMLYQVLLAWENGLTSMEVKVILDSMRAKMGVYSVCAASWLSAYMYAINEDEHEKPLNMIQQLLAPLSVGPDGAEDQDRSDNFKERLGLTNQIIRRMQTEFQSRTTAVRLKLPSNIFPTVLSSNNPLEESFNEAWKSISERKWLSVEAAQTLEGLYESCGAFWLVQRLVHELDKCKYATEIDQVQDIVFAIMHIDIEVMSITLIGELLPMLVAAENSTSGKPTAIARLCVYVVLSAVAKGMVCGSTNKRSRLGEGADSEQERSMKMRKLDAEGDITEELELTATSLSESSELKNFSTVTIREPLNGTIKEMFRRFSQYVVSDEYSPRVNFIFEFVTMLIESGQDAVLRLIPAGFVQNLLKIVPLSYITPGLILQLYDTMVGGRQSALSDLCVLRRNVLINSESLRL